MKATPLDVAAVVAVVAFGILAGFLRDARNRIETLEENLKYANERIEYYASSSVDRDELYVYPVDVATGKRVQMTHGRAISGIIDYLELKQYSSVKVNDRFVKVEP